ncbi:hypothetical protein LJR029_006381 [Caballeronia sp. LjRoot29]|uniref:hypothetical protein n=1 Tax=Caballeronia sp. LjRoot29 TaxID=3342315 RepID=UPI003ECE30D5
MRLIDVLQKYAELITQGTSRTGGAESPEAIKAALSRDLDLVRKTNGKLFAAYWAVLLVSFVACLVLAVVLRNNMGTLTGLLCGEGAIQLVILRQLSAEWREKAYLETFAVLTSSLPAKEMQQVVNQWIRSRQTNGAVRRERKARPPEFRAP